MKFYQVILGLFLVLYQNPGSLAWGGGWGNDPGKVLLRDVNVLTLRDGQMTTGRRSAPVPQLKCVGGSAAGHFKPQVVQCYNRGFDGQDFQWECKADMDNIYRFGAVEVVCEGYDYPDDPYITKGSCGLEYTLEFTKEGYERQKHSSSHSYSHGSNYDSYGGGYTTYKGKTYSKWSGLSDLILLGVVAVVIYALYRTCLAPGQTMGDNQYSSTDGDYPAGGGGGGGGWFNARNDPRYQRGNTGYYDAGDATCGGGGGRQRGTGGGGGFWSGLAAGGLMGYMFGNRGNNGYGGYGYRPRYGSYWGGTGTGGGYFGGGGSGSGSGSGSYSTGSSGTRTASGFGGTRRR